MNNTRVELMIITFLYYFSSGGPSLGGLRIYIRTIDSLTNSVILIPVWRLNNHQSMKWRKARVSLAMASTDPSSGSKVKKAPVNPYQVVIEGIWGDARVGAIAIDDISFVDGECISKFYLSIQIIFSFLFPFSSSSFHFRCTFFTLI